MQLRQERARHGYIVWIVFEGILLEEILKEELSGKQTRYMTCAIFSNSSCRQRSEQLMDSIRKAAVRASWVETP
jgi:hypothetical protein